MGDETKLAVTSALEPSDLITPPTTTPLINHPHGALEELKRRVALITGDHVRDEIWKLACMDAEGNPTREGVKLKALELYARLLGLLVEKHQHTGTITLEHLVVGSQKKGEEG